MGKHVWYVDSMLRALVVRSENIKLKKRISEYFFSGLEAHDLDLIIKDLTESYRPVSGLRLDCLYSDWTWDLSVEKLQMNDFIPPLVSVFAIIWNNSNIKENGESTLQHWIRHLRGRAPSPAPPLGLSLSHPLPWSWSLLMKGKICLYKGKLPIIANRPISGLVKQQAGTAWGQSTEMYERYLAAM